MKVIFPICRVILFTTLVISSGNVRAQDGSDLIGAIMYQDLDRVKELVEAGIDVNYQDENYGSTALILSCQYNFANIAKSLIEAGADTSVKLEDGTSAFTISITGVLSERIGFKNAKTLLNNGADVDEKQLSGAAAGYTCLMLAARNQRPDIVNFLAENGADVNAKADNGNTPISLAEEENDQEMVALLKKLGAK